MAGLEVVKREVDGAAAIVAGAAGGIGDEVALVGRGGIPEHAGDAPGAVGVMDEEADTGGGELLVGAEEGLGGGALEVGGGLRIKSGAHEVVAGGVTDVEVERGGEGTKVDEIGGEEMGGLGGGLGGVGDRAERGDGLLELDAEVAIGIGEAGEGLAVPEEASGGDRVGGGIVGSEVLAIGEGEELAVVLEEDDGLGGIAVFTEQGGGKGAGGSGVLFERGEVRGGDFDESGG